MAELTKVWIVRDPQKGEWGQTAANEVVFEWDVARLDTLIIGTGAAWKAEHTKLYTDEASATKDAKQRWEKTFGKGTWGKRSYAREVRELIRKAEVA